MFNRASRRVLAVLPAALMAILCGGAVPAHAQTQTGFIEICKTSDPAGPVTGSFSFTVQGLAAGQAQPGPIPVGQCTPAIPVNAGEVRVTENLVAGTGVSAITAISRFTGAERNEVVSSDLANRTAVVRVAAGNTSFQTLVTFRNRTIPTGFIEICKDIEAGSTLGGNFVFTVSGVGNITVPAGQCSQLIRVQAGSVTITEQARPDAELVAVTTVPVERLESVDLPNRRAVVRVVAGDESTQTLVRFRNRAVTGQLKICKVAGEGIPVGTPFTFEVGGQRYTVQAGPAPGGFCITDGIFPVGTVVTVQEVNVAADIETSAITVLPGDRLVSSNLANRTATVRIGTGFTEVIFTNRRIPPRFGQLKICKVAGTGVAQGTNFTISAGAVGQPLVAYTVQAGPAPGGYCIVDGIFPVNTRVVVQETIPSGIEVSAINVLPAGRAVAGTTNLGAGRVEVIIGTGFTEVIFTDRRPPGTPSGCSPGFWKNHLSSWPAGYLPTQRVSAYFTGAETANANATLIQALEFGGGSGVEGAERILLRQAVAALLNAASNNGYPLTVAQVRAQVSAALATNNRGTILALATTLDRYNNLGCRLD